jgi:hypothetical protein
MAQLFTFVLSTVQQSTAHNRTEMITVITANLIALMTTTQSLFVASFSAQFSNWLL